MICQMNHFKAPKKMMRSSYVPVMLRKKEKDGLVILQQILNEIFCVTDHVYLPQIFMLCS